MTTIRVCEVCSVEFEYVQKKKTCSIQCYKEHKNRREKETRRKNRASYALMGARARAKKRSIPFDLTLDDIVIPTHCPILGIELEHRDKQGPNGSSPSIDRIYPALGYIKGNIQIISQKANLMKQDATPDELLMFADWVRANV